MHAVFVRVGGGQGSAHGSEVAVVLDGEREPRAWIVRCPLSRRRFVFIGGGAAVHLRADDGVKTKVEPGRLRVEVPYEARVVVEHASYNHRSAPLAAREWVHVGSLVSLVLVAAFEMTVVAATRW